MVDMKMLVKETEERAKQLGIDLSQVDLDSIHLPLGEDFGIISDDEDLLQESLKLESGFENIIIIDGLPIITPEKFELLKRRVRERFGEIGVVKDDSLWMPVDPTTQKTLGYCFMECATLKDAETAKKKSGWKLDKNHPLSVTTFEDFDRVMKAPDEWVRPEISPYTPGEFLQQWLTDEKARDQFVIRSGSDTEVFWNDARHLKPEPVYKRPFWTDSFVQWSSLGTYLATVHRQGVAVWGGAGTFDRLMRFSHPQVELIDFSPCERYLVTYCSNSCDANLKSVINIFDVRTGKLMRGFDDFALGGTGGGAQSWPVFRWGGGKDDKYFSMIGKNVISVYETETFSLIDKKRLKVENVIDFCWSPTDPIIALFVPELGGGNQPARVSLVQIPGKEELRQKNLFSVSDCKMYWQNNGDYLAVKVDRYTKTKKSIYTGFELFRIKERDIPIEVLELENKTDKIIAFAWEPKGHRFAVIHGDDMRPDISFYSMRSTHNSGRVSKLTTLRGKQANDLFWSPTGRFIILAGLKGFNGQLEFFDVDELETMATVEHFKATHIEWDPTGRYVATAVTSVHEMENGFNIWSFYGKLLYRVLKDNFFQFAWRPRSPSLLSPEKEEEIAKNLKKYSKKYEAEDQSISMLLNEQDQKKRSTLKEEWEKLVNEWKRLHDEEELLRHKLRDGEASDEEEEYKAKEVEVEEILDVVEDILFDV